MNPTSWLPLASGGEFTQPRAHLLADPCMLVAFPPLGTWYNHRRETNVNMAPSLTQPRFHPFPDDCGYRVRSFRSILSRSRCSFAVFPPLFPSNALREVNIMGRHRQPHSLSLSPFTLGISLLRVASNPPSALKSAAEFIGY